MKYWLGANTGAGFIRGREQLLYEIRGYAGNTWVTNNSDEAITWASRNSLTEKTKAEATTIQETAIENNVTAWNNLSDSEIKGDVEPSEEAIP